MTMARQFQMLLMFGLIVVGRSAIDDAFNDINEYRLPRSTRPTNYDLWLKVDVDRAVFSGSVKITIEVIEQTDTVALNVRDVIVDYRNVSLMDGENVVYKPSSVNNDINCEILSLKFDHRLKVNNIYVLSVQFDGAIRNDSKGLYKTSYEDGKNKRWMATTFLAPNYARTIFPCYDEPNMKATFKINVVHPTKYNALSNMPIKSEPLLNEDGTTLTSFEETRLMSTYLLALVVSDLMTLDTEESNKISIYTQESVANSTALARVYSQQALEAIENYLGMKYQLPKLKLVAMEEFSMGAMENWGLITFRNSYLLYTAGISPFQQQQQVVSTVTHELLHMFFGNEVTCDWWSVVWLNEGFATFLESYISDKLYPDWHIMEQFNSKFLHTSLRKDDDPNVGAMTRPIRTPKEISEIYDFVVYSKAASIIRMAQHVMGDEPFRKALHTYLTGRSFKSAQPVHLFEAMEATVANKSDVADNLALMMRSWTTTPGYPVVRVNRTYDSVGTTLISQERFFSNDEDTSGYLYHIPLNYAMGSSHDFVDTEPTHWLSSEQNLITVNIVESDWLIFNKQQFGYYRVNYDLKNWALITGQLSGPGFLNIHALNRAQLIDDSHYLARSGQLPLLVALEILSYVHQETDLSPLRAAMEEIHFVLKKFAGHERYTELRQYLHGLFEAIYNNVKTASMTEHYRSLTLIEISGLACKFGVSACTTEAMKQFRIFERIPVERRQALLCSVVKESDKRFREWDELTKRLVYVGKIPDRKVKNTAEINDIMNAMVCTSNVAKMEQFLNMSIDRQSPIGWSKVDRNKIFELALESEYGTMVALDFLNANFKEMIEMYDSMESVLASLGPIVTTPKQQNKLKEIKQIHLFEMDQRLVRTFDEALQKAHENLVEAQQLSEKIAEWLTRNNVQSGAAKFHVATHICSLIIPYLLVHLSL